MLTSLLRTGPAHERGKPYNETMDGIIDGKINCDKNGDEVHIRAAKCMLNLFKKYGIRAFFYRDIKRNWMPESQLKAYPHHSGIVGLYEKMFKKTSQLTPYAQLMNNRPIHPKLMKFLKSKGEQVK